MTKREAKAVELLRICQQSAYNYSLKIDSDYSKLGDPNPSDEVLIKMYYPEYEAILTAMAWQSEQCVLASGGLKGDQQMIAIRNAGREEV